MVAYVYKTTRTLGDYPREILKLSGSPTAMECEVSEFYTNGSNYSSEITIGGDRNYIRLKGCVVHDVVRSVIIGESLATKRIMRDYIDRLIKEEEDNK